MGTAKKPGNSKDRKERDNHANDVRLRPLAKDGDKLMTALNCDKMVGILSKNEIMYMFIARGNYLCYIHPLDAEEGRCKSWEINERNTAMFKNLTSVADQIFEITPKKGMNPMGVMVAAEKGIISFLDATGQLPAQDYDFMEWQEKPESDETKEGST